MSRRKKKETIAEKKARAARLVAELRVLYPDADCELGHDTALQLLVATILSAQCTDARVNMVTPELFARYRSAADFAGADPAELERIIHSTGFFRNKAKSIVGLGKALVERYDGEVPDRMEQLVELPGIGRKTANVLLGSWFRRPAIPVDTHVQRLAGRLGLTDATDPVKIEFALQELFAEKDWRFASIALIFHGRRVCAARTPACDRCTVRPDCPYPAA